MENNNLDNTVNIAVTANGAVSNEALNYDADKKDLVDKLEKSIEIFDFL